MDNDEKHTHQGIRRTELLATILLALATTATAWCAYQGTVWDGEQTFSLHDSNTLERRAAEKTVLAHQQRMIDVTVLLHHMDALAQGENSLADFYAERFRQEAKKAVDAWLALNPLENPDAPPHPFVLPEYTLKLEQEAAELNQMAADRLSEAEVADHHSDSYTLLTVLFACVLFFAGISTQLDSVKLRRLVVYMGIILFVVSVLILLSYPVAIR